MIFNHMDRIVFIGDSVTDMGSAYPIGEGLFDNVGRGYPRVIENMLSAYYPEVYVRVTNSAISGQTSRDLRERFDRDVIDLKPNFISICIGINDVWRRYDTPAMLDGAVFEDEYEKNMTEMIEKSIKYLGDPQKLFIVSPYYMEPSNTDVMRATIDNYVAICKKLAEKYGCRFVDLQTMFNKYFKYRHSSYIAADRVHPNQIGATLIAREFLKQCDFDYDHVAE